MKKTVVTALTTVFVATAMGTTMAASNPFSDVPSDHWAYDAVEKLAADGIIEGYGDATFHGSKNITRYEMAQMVAKAMAKNNASGADKATIDKLAAEFADELNNLGVRVANLERNADKVKWQGMLRYDYGSVRYDEYPVTNSKHKAGDLKTRDNENTITFRLEPQAEVNENWKVKARLDSYIEMSKDEPTYGSDGNVKLKRIWAEGKYGNTMYRLGKMPVTIDMDIMFDTQFTGAQVQFGNKLKTTINAGRFNLGSGNQYYGYGKAQAAAAGHKDDTASYQAIGFTGNVGKLFAGTAYHHLNSNAFGYMIGYDNDGTNQDDMNTWTAKGTYHFDKNIAFQVNYGHNFSADAYNNSHSLVLGYKDFENFDTSNAGQWGMALAYRRIGQNVGPTPTYTLDAGTRGFELSYLGNIMSHTYIWLKGVTGKTLIGNRNYKELFARVEWQF